MEKLLCTLVSDGSPRTLLENTHTGICTEPNSYKSVPGTASGPAFLTPASPSNVSCDFPTPVIGPIPAKLNHCQTATPSVHNPSDASCRGWSGQFGHETQECPPPGMQPAPGSASRRYQIRTLSFDSEDNADDCFHSGCDEEDGLSWGALNEFQVDETHEKSAHPSVKSGMAGQKQPLSSSREPGVLPVNREPRRITAKPGGTPDDVQTVGHQAMV